MLITQEQKKLLVKWGFQFNSDNEIVSLPSRWSWSQSSIFDPYHEERISVGQLEVFQETHYTIYTRYTINIEKLRVLPPDPHEEGMSNKRNERFKVNVYDTQLFEMMFSTDTTVTSIDGDDATKDILSDLRYPAVSYLNRKFPDWQNPEKYWNYHA